MRFDLLVVSIGILAGLAGLRKKNPKFLEFQRRAVYVSGGLIVLTTAILVAAFYLHDFSLRYVATYSSRNLPMGYCLTALWAGQEGSQLFWLLILALYTTAYSLVHRRERSDPHFHATALVLLLVQHFFLSIVNFASNPYVRLDPVPADGNGLNPLLQHPAMAVHPPMLYTGFVGMAVPFACAMGALITDRLDGGWIKKCRTWTIFSWTILAIGILLGGRWAYDELGWGGYWAWDPVENSSFIPWLTATAFLHSVMIQERRGMLKIWNMTLITLTFLLTIFGTYMTRSGVVSSVHSFARQPVLGAMFLTFIGTAGVCAFALIVSRAGRLRAEHRIESMLSREAIFLFNNVILLALAFSILFGTIFPSIYEMVNGNRISVGPLFYNTVAVPMFFVLLVLTGVGPTITWRRSTRSHLIRNFAPPTAAAILAAAALFVMGVHRGNALAGIACIVFVLACLILEFYRDTSARRRSTGESFLTALWRLIGKNRRRYGGYIVHAGVAVMALGIAASSSYQVKSQVQLGPGESAQIDRFRIQMVSLTEGKIPNATWVRATLNVYQGDRSMGQLRAEKRMYEKTEQPHTQVAVLVRLFYDFYVVLAGWTEKGEAILEVYVNPLVSWVWGGGFIVLIGSAICLWPSQARIRDAGPGTAD